MKLFTIIALVGIGTVIAGPTLRGGRILQPPLPDPSACDDPSALPPYTWICPQGFPVIITGFFVCGLPDQACGPTGQITDDEVPSRGRNPNGAYYRIEDETLDPPALCADNNIVKVYEGKGKGANFEEPDPNGFKWSGSFVLARPPGQTSHDENFPDGQPGLWEVSGMVSFEDESYTLGENAYRGAPPFDICAYLAEAE